MNLVLFIQNNERTSHIKSKRQWSRGAICPSRPSLNSVQLGMSVMGGGLGPVCLWRRGILI